MCDTAARSPARLLAAFFLVLISFRVVFPKSSFARHCHTGAKEKGLQLLLSALRFLEKPLLPPRMAEYPYLDGTESVNAKGHILDNHCTALLSFRFPSIGRKLWQRSL